MHRSPLLLVLAPVVAALTACGGAPAPSSAAPSSAAPSSVVPPTVAPSIVAAPLTSAAPAPDPVLSATVVPAPGAAPSSAGPWVMPNLVGTVLQDAQDRVQALTGDEIFVTTSHDATGAGRNQVVDRNWKVCDQNVAPGRSITAGTRIDFGTVKLTERC